jgi:hypothetical protein
MEVPLVLRLGLMFFEKRQLLLETSKTEPIDRLHLLVMKVFYQPPRCLFQATSTSSIRTGERGIASAGWVVLRRLPQQGVH